MRGRFASHGGRCYTLRNVLLALDRGLKLIMRGNEPTSQQDNGKTALFIHADIATVAQTFDLYPFYEYECDCNGHCLRSLGLIKSTFFTPNSDMEGNRSRCRVYRKSPSSESEATVI